jgi:hypothetical protein
MAGDKMYKGEEKRVAEDENSNAILSLKTFLHIDRSGGSRSLILPIQS